MINAFITVVVAILFFVSLLLCIPMGLLLRRTRASSKYIFRALRVSVLRYPRRFFVLLKLVFAKWLRKHFAAKITRNRLYPEVCVLQVTNQCNNNCEFCFSHGDVKTEIPINTVSDIVGEMKAKGCVLFIVSGGEPSLYSGLERVIGENRDAYFVIITNGKKPAEIMHIAGKYRNCVFLISMQSCTDESSAIRGKDTVASAEELMRRFRNKKIPFGINCVLTRSGFAQMSSADTYRRMEKLGAVLLWLVPYIPIGKGSHGDHFVSRRMLDDFHSSLRDIRMKTSLVILSLLGKKELISCSAGKHIVYIDAFTNVYPCMFLTEPIGSLGRAGDLLEMISKWADQNWNRKAKTCLALQNAERLFDHTEER